MMDKWVSGLMSDWENCCPLERLISCRRSQPLCWGVWNLDAQGLQNWPCYPQWSQCGWRASLVFQTWENQRSLVYTWYITPGYSCFHRNAVGYSSKVPPCALSQVVSIGDQPFGFWRAGTCGLWILWKWQAKIHELSCYVQLITLW